MEIKVEILSSDILDNTDIKSIVEDEIRKATRDYFKNNTNYGSQNIAFHLKEFVLHDVIEEHIEDIRVKFNEQLEKFEFSNYDLDKNNAITNMMFETVEQNKSKIQDKAQETIDKRLEDYNFDSWQVSDKIAEVYKDVIVEALHNKFNQKDK